MSIADKAVVKDQYATSAKLETRISIHEKYSRNKQPFGDWVAGHYDLHPGDRVLELGCGTGSMWRGVSLPGGCRITLTDLSAGMLDAARTNTAHLNADYRCCDAMEIPWPDASFDVVIANMMLYHVPDINQALQEIRRVLRPSGRFYAATFGEHGVVESVLEMLSLPCTANHRFTMQNGGDQLAKHFAQVEAFQRADALDVPCLVDLIGYLRSLAGMTVLDDIPDEHLAEVFTRHMQNGVLSLPKEYGIFVCQT